MGALVPAGGGGPMGLRGMAHARVGGIWRRLRRRGGLRVGARRVWSRRRAARARRRIAIVGVHRRHGGRDRFPADVDGRLPPAGVARGLRRGAGRAGRPPRPGVIARGDPPRSRLVRLPGHLAVGVGRRLPGPAGWRNRRHRGGKRRRQVDAGEAARQDVRALVRRDSCRRDAARARAGRRMADAPGGRVPGFLPFRVHRPAHGRPGRPAAHGR